MPHRDFDAYRKERDQDKPRTQHDVSFRLGGIDFECIKILPSGLILDLAAAPDPEEKPMEAVAALRNFVLNIIVEGQRDQFLEVLRRPDDPADFDTLAAVVEYLSREYAGRPTTPPLPSGNGRSETGPISKRVSLSKRTVEVETS